MPPIDFASQTIWQLDVCNACRYCEGYCAVFPALEKRRNFTYGDVIYLANLCHDCRACYYACMYAPPHEFGVNIPQTLAEVRQQTYAHYALPRIAGRLVTQHWRLLILGTLLGTAFFAALAILMGDSGGLTAASVGPGAFYKVVPYSAMVLPFLVLAGYALAVLLMGAFAFVRDVGGEWRWSALGQAAGDAFTLRYLQGGTGDGCYYPADRTSHARLILHMLVFYGFLSATAATIAAFVLQDILGELPPYPLWSVPVVLGSLGGVAMIVGSTGLLALKWRSDRAPRCARNLSHGRAVDPAPGNGRRAVRLRAVWQVRAPGLSLRGACPASARIALMLDLVVRNGTLVTSAAETAADIGIQGEHLAAIAAPGALSGAEVLDATGRFVCRA